LTELPPAFIEHNAVDSEWLGRLPRLLAELAERWSLVRVDHFAEIRINYVASAVARDGTHCVLKVSGHVGVTRTEIAALRLWSGRGAARLLKAHADLGALLLERLEPGTQLADVA
jgi:streptomycin 6-kinase